MRSLPGSVWADNACDNAYMHMQHASFGNSKKRPIDSMLEFQPPTQRKCMGLSRQRFLPMGASSARMDTMFRDLCQQVARSARPMPQHHPLRLQPFAPVTMDPAATISSKPIATTPSTMGSSPPSTADTPLDFGLSTSEKRKIKDLMLDVVSTCLSHREHYPSQFH